MRLGSFSRRFVGHQAVTAGLIGSPVEALEKFTGLDPERAGEAMDGVEVGKSLAFLDQMDVGPDERRTQAEVFLAESLLLPEAL